MRWPIFEVVHIRWSIWGGPFEVLHLRWSNGPYLRWTLWEVHMRWSIWEVHITGQRFQLKVKWQGFVDDAGPVGSLHPWWEISVAKSDQGSSDWWFHQKPQLILRKYRLFTARRDTSFYETDPDTIKKRWKSPQTRTSCSATFLLLCIISTFRCNSDSDTWPYL